MNQSLFCARFGIVVLNDSEDERSLTRIEEESRMGDRKSPLNVQFEHKNNAKFGGTGASYPLRTFMQSAK